MFAQTCLEGRLLEETQWKVQALAQWQTAMGQPIVGHAGRSLEPGAHVEEWQLAGKRLQRKARWHGKQGNKQLSQREAYGTDHQHGDAGLGT